MTAIKPAGRSTKRVMVGPQDHGQRMSLADFEFAEVQEGYTYELERGVIIVSDVPGSPHFAQVDALRIQLYGYRMRHPDPIRAIASGSDCKLLLYELETERHPDLSVYKKSPPRLKNPWPKWVPEIVVEIVSQSSRRRDYHEKREDYLRMGVKEYWIFDPDRKELLVLRRLRGRWSEQTIRPPQLYRTRLLPGFKLDCAAVFEAGEEAAD